MVDDKKNKGKGNKFYGIAIVVLLCTLGLLSVFVVPWSTIFPSPPPTPTPAENYSYVYINDWTDRETLNELCPIEIWGNDKNIDTIEDIYDISNYEIAVSECYPEKVKDDLSEYTHIMIRVNPDEATDGYWTTYDYFYPNYNQNFNYYLNAYHEATDIYGAVRDQESCADWDGLTANVTVPVWYPISTITEPHYGTGWEISDTDFDDLTTIQLARLYNERYHRNMPTLFSLADDTADHSKTSGDYMTITETSAIEIVFNTTISNIDGNADQVNFTADCDIDHFVEQDGTALYIVFGESWDCYNTGIFVTNFEVACAVNITGVTVKIGRIVIPNRNFAGYTFTSLETLLTVA